MKSNLKLGASNGSEGGPGVGLLPPPLHKMLQRMGFAFTGKSERYDVNGTIQAQEWSHRGKGLFVDVSWRVVEGGVDNGKLAIRTYSTGQFIQIPSGYLFSNTDAAEAMIEEAAAYNPSGR